MMDQKKNRIQLLAKYSARLAGVIILASAVLISVEVICRNLGINFSLYSFELTNYGFACAVAFALSYATAQRSHIRIDLFYRLAPVKMKAILDIASMFTLFLLASGMSYYAWKVVIHSAKLNARPNTSLDIPLAIPQAIWATGLTFFAFVSVTLFLRNLITFFQGNTLEVCQELGVISADSDRCSND